MTAGTDGASGRPDQRVVMVAAVERGGWIGQDGGMPWHLPADLRHFRAVTMGHPIVMGRRTWDAIGRALPGRRNIVLTRDDSRSFEGAERVRDLDEALALLADEPAIMIIGGGQIYEMFMPLATDLELTFIDADLGGDTRFPDVDQDEWVVTAVTPHEPDETNAWPYRFVTLRRAGVRGPR